MIPPMSSREKSKTREKRGARIRIPHPKGIAIPAVKKPLRKEAHRVADPAGEIREEALPPSGAAPAVHLPAHQNPLDEKTVSVKEAAYRLGKSTDAVYQWLRTGRLRGRQPGGRRCAILVVEASLNEALLCCFERASVGRSNSGPLPL